jgi:hypothetical protein
MVLLSFLSRQGARPRSPRSGYNWLGRAGCSVVVPLSLIGLTSTGMSYRRDNGWIGIPPKVGSMPCFRCKLQVTRASGRTAHFEKFDVMYGKSRQGRASRKTRRCPI